MTAGSTRRRFPRLRGYYEGLLTPGALIVLNIRLCGLGVVAV